MSDLDGMNVGLRWYVAHTYSGYENKVKTNLEKIVENRGLGNLIYEVKVPVETVIEKDGDKEKVKELKLYPSYVFIKMIMTDESWHAVRHISGFTGFVGPGARPTPLTEQEVIDMHLEGEEETKVQLSFNVGDEVSVVGGLFEGYDGVVQSITDDLKIVTVLVKRGRRDMPVEIETEMLKLKAHN